MYCPEVRNQTLSRRLLCVALLFALGFLGAVFWESSRSRTEHFELVSHEDGAARQQPLRPRVQESSRLRQVPTDPGCDDLQNEDANPSEGLSEDAPVVIAVEVQWDKDRLEALFEGWAEKRQHLESIRSPLATPFECITESFRSYHETTGARLSEGHCFQYLFYGGHHRWGTSFGDAWSIVFTDLGIPIDDERRLEQVRTIVLESARAADEEARGIDNLYGLHDLPISHPRYDEAAEVRYTVFSGLHRDFRYALQEILTYEELERFDGFLASINVDLEKP